MNKLPTSIHEVPFVRLVLPLIVGIEVQHQFSLFEWNAFFVFAIAGLAVLAILVSFVLNTWRLRWVYGLILNVSLVLLGAALMCINQQQLQLSADKDTQLIAKLEEEPSSTAKVRKVKAKVLYEFDEAQSHTSKNRIILLYFSLADSIAGTLQYGDVLALKGKLKGFREPQNPNQFNMKQYMKQQGVAGFVSVRSNSWLAIGKNPNPIMACAIGARSWVINTFKHKGLEGQELAVLSALLVGYKGLLDDEIRQVYSSVGAMHILAVSGLHVGLVYGVVLLFLSLLPKRKTWLFTRLFLALASLWAYVLITGFSPSVNRAALMFSMLAIGQLLGLRSNSFNTLAAAAFILLVVDPSMLFSLGFQLSFVAVLSILIFYPLIHSLIQVKSWILKPIWSLVAISAAAQLLTAPLTLYYFGQFPTLFLFTNLVAIPLATLVLYMALGTLLLQFIEPLGDVLALLVERLTQLLNAGLRFIDNIPFSSVKQIYFKELHVVLLTASILLFIAYLSRRRILVLNLAILLLISIFLFVGFHRLSMGRTSELVILWRPQTSVVCFNNAGTPITFTADSTSSVDLTDDFATRDYFRNSALRKPVMYGLKGSDDAFTSMPVRLYARNGFGLLVHGNYTVALAYSDSVRYLSCDVPIKVNLLLLNHYSDLNILTLVKPDFVVFDPSVKHWKTNAFIKQLLASGIKYHDMSQSGAYRVRLQ